MRENPPAMQCLAWQEPLELASKAGTGALVLLYSSASLSYSGRYSFLAVDAEETVQGSTFAALEKVLRADRPRHTNAWFGYLGYGLKNDVEKLSREAPGRIRLPELWMTRFATLYRFDHSAQTLERYGRPQAWEEHPASALIPFITSSLLSSNMTKAEYMKAVRHTVARIHAGDLYQANLTRKFYGDFEKKPDALSVFARLCQVSPAPYSALIRSRDWSVLSSSPERFLHIGADGRITTRPIKGTAPRHADSERDRRAAKALGASAKDRAENLMIVDLMRNDLARISAPGSVRAEALFEVTSHPNVHHMSSTVTAQKSLHASTLEVVKACFPPGSMTGAPKIKAMQLCSKLESIARGVYSGALGWFGGDGSADLSVVIRTLVMEGSRFEFQVGGGIVADSTPESEWAETMTKARGMMQALGISMEAVEKL